MADVNARLLRRMLALRQFSLFATAELAELATIAENVVETTFPAGAVIAPAAARLPGLHLVLDGRIDAGRSWGRHEIFGALEAFAGRDHLTRAVAATETRTLQLSSSDLSEVLEDNFGVLLSVVRELAARMLVAGPPARLVVIPNADGELGLVDRLIVLRQLAPFVGARLQGLAMLAHGSQEVRWAPGTTVVRAGDLASGSLLVLEGTLRGQGGQDRGGSYELGRGQVYGALETLAGLGHSATLEAITPVRLLHSGGTEILDVLEDHPDIGMSMIGTFARSLLDHAADDDARAAEGGN